MNVRLHIERLVLDEAWGGVEPAVLGRMVERELTRLLAGSRLDRGLAVSGAVAAIRGGDVPGRETAAGAGGLAAQISAAVHAGLTGESRGAP
ncbi:hypothetical protein FHU33_2306 [Blastococcus colisei]|uniref:Uncharacterized protein n=1 Tax=Blastococcus colisei TaxID=1564162 RepID=A0A543PFP0_9ACTN|nr:hypothetical protein [Blastococcus colisei]TQN42895.1 hypothetical protein FHU33_2306 [Blastococcus colisei]